MNFILLLLYDLALKIYFFAIFIFSFFNDKAKKWVDGRKNIFVTIEKKISEVRTPNSELVWFHCSSLGEFEQGRPLIEKIRSQNPKVKIILTFFSPSGYEVRKNYAIADAVFYLPLDSKENAEKFIGLLKPRLSVFVKYEFWHHYISVLHSKNIPSILVSALFRNNQIFFKWYGMFFKNLLPKFSHIFVQDENSLRLLQSVGVQNTSLANDTRFDRVLDISRQVKPILLIEKFKDGKNIFIAGSTWEKDEDIISNCKLQIANCKLIIAPHEIDEKHLQTIIQKFNKSKIIRYSQANENNVHDKDMLLIDNIGILSSLYQYGKFAYIGGGFGRTIHNIQEPAVFGLPVFFGPHFRKFNEAKELVKTNGAFPIKNADELEEKLFSLIKNESEYQTASEICKKYVLSKSGGTKMILDYLNSSKIFS